jgi:hypothetical protein
VLWVSPQLLLCCLAGYGFVERVGPDVKLILAHWFTSTCLPQRLACAGTPATLHVAPAFRQTHIGGHKLETVGKLISLLQQ